MKFAAIITGATVGAASMLWAASPPASADSGRHDDGPGSAPRVHVLNDDALDGLGSGSTVGPDGALYVTNGKQGTLLRIHPSTGVATVVGTGLPPAVVEIGGAMDVAFLHGRAYVLVSLAGADLGVTGTPMGLYVLVDDGRFSPFADIGAFAAANPPADPDVFLTEGVQYAVDVWRDGFLVTDGHHGRVYRISRSGDVSEFLTFPSTDTVLTGIETSKGDVLLATPGPIPHDPAASSVLEVRRGRTEVIAGWADDYQGDAGLLVDVEYGRRGELYGLLQGHWDLDPVPDNEGFPAAHDTGELVRVRRDGTFETVLAGLDQPTSLDFIGKSAYVVTLNGGILRVDGL
ncbi:MAG: ScyD/ScyE family protein [Acidimicrobiia bacterium]